MKKLTTIYFLILITVFMTSCENEANGPSVSSSLEKNDFPIRPTQDIIKNINNDNGKISLLKSASIISDLNTLSPTDLANALIGTGPNSPSISNVSYTGALNAAGTFMDADEVFGFENGIVLSSGNVINIQGPNMYPDVTQANNLLGDSDLDGLIPNYITYDASVLEFDFECEFIQTISFQYVFSSDEYNEYVGSDFNDVFGFFVNGVNIAIIPETTTPVSINNLNCGNPYGMADNYCYLFNNNAELTDFDTEMDGFTTILTATTTVNPGINHIKLAIADAGDYFLDSNVLIKGESFVCAPPVLPILIEIKPMDENTINCHNVNEVIPIAILTTDDFDATTVDHESVRFHGASEYHLNKKSGTLKRHENDADGDGDIDLVLHFLLTETNLDCNSLEGTLTGELFDGTPIQGSDSVIMIDANN